MKRKLVAAIACRNQGTRLYGKPMQNLDIDEGLSIIEYMIRSIRTYQSVDEIVLGISEGNDNIAYISFADRLNVPYIVGDEEDVLARLIQCTKKVGGSDIFRLTSESPFTYFEAIESAWQDHLTGDYDLTALDHLPDGSGFEIIRLESYEKSHRDGEERHRSELCSLYMRENKNKFKFNFVEIPEEIKRTDIRLTIDYPEDLVLCRAVYSHFKDKAPRIPLIDIIRFLDSRPDLKNLVEPFVADGLKTMYVWAK